MLIDRYRVIPALLDAVALEHNSPERQLEVAHNCGAKQIAVRTSLAFRLTARGRHLREVANTRGKRPSHEDEHRRADSPSRRRLRQFGLRPPTFSRDAFPGCFWLTLVQCQGRTYTAGRSRCGLSRGYDGSNEWPTQTDSGSILFERGGPFC